MERRTVYLGLLKGVVDALNGRCQVARQAGRGDYWKPAQDGRETVKETDMKRLLQLLTLACFLATTATFAAGGGGGGGGGGMGGSSGSGAAGPDPLLKKAEAAIESENWELARATLKDAVAKDPRNADYHNLYAYALRKGANPDMDMVFKHYQEALALNPKHRGAHEDVGEAYLMVGNVAKAKEHLATLDALCFFTCEEYTELKEEIEKYESKSATR
jgi:tetratricopeptide (TPR) repeat protein